MNPLKPVVYITINGVRFHFANAGRTPNAVITSFSFKDTDGSGKTDKAKKGNRDVLSFSFRDFDSATQSFISDRPLFKVGNIVQAQWGFQDFLDLSPKKWMKIASVKVSYPSGGDEVATVECHDFSKDMNRETKDVTRPSTKLKKNQDTLYFWVDVVREIGEEDGFTSIDVDFDLGNKQSKGWQQKKESNIQFLQRIAKDFGANVYITTPTKKTKILHFRHKKKVIKSRSWGVLHRGKTAEFFEKQGSSKKVALMLSFDPKVDLEKSASDVSTSFVKTKGPKKVEKKNEETRETSWNTLNFDDGSLGDPILEPAGNSGLTPSDEDGAVATKDARKKKLNQPAKDEKDADAKTEGMQQVSNDSAITASANVLGQPSLRAKVNLITTGRIGAKWRGQKWYVSSCTHKIDSSGYFCDLDMTAPPPIAPKANVNKAQAAEKTKEAATETIDETAIDTETGELGNRTQTVKDRNTGKTIKKTIIS